MCREADQIAFIQTVAPNSAKWLAYYDRERLNLLIDADDNAPSRSDAAEEANSNFCAWLEALVVATAAIKGIHNSGSLGSSSTYTTMVYRPSHG